MTLGYPRAASLILAAVTSSAVPAALAHAQSTLDLSTTQRVPLPENYKEIAEQQIAPTLRDPSTARFEFRSQPYRMTCKRGTLNPRSPTDIWMIDVWVNGTNGFGGYTGFQPWSVAIFLRGEDLMAQPYSAPGGGALTRYKLCKPA